MSRSRSRRDRRLGLDEAQLGHRLELADVPRQLQERVETGALARAEAVTQLLEVPREKAGRIAVSLRRLVRQLLRLGARLAHRCDQRVFELEQLAGHRLR